MKRKVIAILLLIALSGACTIYGLFLVLTFHYEVVNGTAITSRASAMAIGRQFFLIPLSIGVIGWLTAAYEVLTFKRGEITGSLRRRMSREGFDRDLYRIFSGRGGARRLAILQVLDTPKLRNEIAKITGTDWKEVERNVKILESVNLVRIQFSHGSLSVYRLTESGRELMYIIQSQKDDKYSGTSIVRS